MGYRVQLIIVDVLNDRIYNILKDYQVQLLSF